ncbi:hypothetical protein H4R19_000786 [Coemansia spiralis]|nr:hypothetical protein H4R19_000786 [Coemansia spiralis]
MTLEDSSQRNLDKIGGIIAAALFAVCLTANAWQWARHRCHPLGVLAVFLVLRVVGWLLAFIGAVNNDQLLNKRGYIVNAVAFWLMMLAGLLLLARWDASRRGARWGVRSWGGTGAALLLCVVFGALDAAGQITWLNNPSDDPEATLKAASVGFVVLAGLYGLCCLFFTFRETLIYQRASIRWAFFLSAPLLVVRCVCWMLVGLNIVHFDEPKRIIFLYCLTTTFEIAVAAVWCFMPVAKHLRSEGKGDASELESIKPESVVPIRPLPVDTAIPAHTLNARPSSDSEPSEAYSDEYNNDGGIPAHNGPATHTASWTSAPGQASNSSALGAHTSYYQPAPASGPPVNPWSGAAQAVPLRQSGIYPPQANAYAQPPPAGLVSASPYASNMAHPGQPVMVQRPPQPILLQQSPQMYPQPTQIQQQRMQGQPQQMQFQPQQMQAQPQQMQAQPQQMQAQPQLMQGQQQPMQLQPQQQLQGQPQPMQVQHRPALMQAPGAPMYNNSMATAPVPAPAVSFVGPSQPQFVGVPAQHTTFVKTPYPAVQPAQVPQAAPGQASFVDHTRSVPAAGSLDQDNDSSRESSMPPDVATMHERRAF